MANMSDKTLVRVQFGSFEHGIFVELHDPKLDVGRTMRQAQSIGATALETIKLSLLKNEHWKEAVRAEQLPTLFNI